MREWNKNCCAILGLWTANNYGSVLTAWSLYRQLEKMGYYPVLVDSKYSRNKESKLGEFIRQSCRTTKYYSTSTEMIELNDHFDTFIVGSDQNWNDYWLEENKGFSYFLDFVDDSKRKISYATSFGNDDYRGLEEEVGVIKQLLMRFDKISLREMGAAKLWEDILGCDIACTIDPIFFTSREEYEELAEKHCIEKNGKYLFEFILDIYQEAKDVVSEAARSLDVEHVLYLGADFHPQDDNIYEWDRNSHTVYELLSQISNAEYVVTDSFHVMCLSIILHKPFLCLENNRGKARIETILTKFGLKKEEYLIDVEISRNFDWRGHFKNLSINWEIIDSIIDKWRIESIHWLKMALTCKVQEKQFDEQLLLMQITNLAAVGNRNAYNGKNRMDVIDSILAAMNERFSVLDRIILEQHNEINVLKKLAANLREDKLKLYLKRVISTNCRIAIRGGGEHTRRLLELLDEISEEKKLTFLYVIDKKTEKKEWLPTGCEVVSPDSFWNEKKQVDSIIISSSKYRGEVLEEIFARNQYGYEVIDPYEAFEDGDLIDGRAWFD